MDHLIDILIRSEYFITFFAVSEIIQPCSGDFFLQEYEVT